MSEETDLVSKAQQDVLTDYLEAHETLPQEAQGEIYDTIMSMWLMGPASRSVEEGDEDRRAWFHNALHIFINDLGDLKMSVEEEAARRTILQSIAVHLKPFLDTNTYPKKDA